MVNNEEPNPHRLWQPPTPRLLSAPLAAAFLGVSPRTFEKLWRTGSFPHPHRIGRRLLWDRKLLDQFVDVLSGVSSDALTEATQQPDRW